MHSEEAEIRAETGNAGASMRRAPAVLRAMRPHQWVKNLLLFVPLIVSHRITEHQPGHLPLLSAAIFAFWSFSLAASAVYIVNDLLDIEADRRHPTKRHRPFAAGELSTSMGLMLAAAAMAVSAVIALFLPWKFAALLSLYLLLTSLYSFWLKRKLLVDVMVLAALYTHRVLAGAAAVAVVPSPWLLAFALFFFLSLAFVKRYSELIQVEGAGGEEVRGRNYTVNDLRIIESVGPTSGYLSVMVFCIYLDSPMVKGLYAHPQALWLVTPILLYWITRIWFIARRRALHDDPIVFAIRDRVSYIAGALVALILILASLPGKWTL